MAGGGGSGRRGRGAPAAAPLCKCGLEQRVGLHGRGCQRLPRCRGLLLRMRGGRRRGCNVVVCRRLPLLQHRRLQRRRGKARNLQRRAGADAARRCAVARGLRDAGQRTAAGLRRGPAGAGVQTSPGAYVSLPWEAIRPAHQKARVGLWAPGRAVEPLLAHAPTGAAHLHLPSLRRGGGTHALAARKQCLGGVCGDVADRVLAY
jgi:hypothetical protein